MQDTTQLIANNGATISTLLTVIVPMILTGIGTAFMFFAKRGLFDGYFSNSRGSRKLINAQKEQLENHKLFASIDRYVLVDLLHEKERYSTRINSVVYFSMMIDLLETIRDNINSYVHELKPVSGKDKNVNALIMLSGSFVPETVKKYSDRRIPKAIIRKFDIFSLLHGSIFYSSVENVVNHASDYYEEIDDFLDMMWVLVTWLVDESKFKHLDFNGDTEKLLTEELKKNINLRIEYEQLK